MPGLKNISKARQAKESLHQCVNVSSWQSSYFLSYSMSNVMEPETYVNWSCWLNLIMMSCDFPPPMKRPGATRSFSFVQGSRKSICTTVASIAYGCVCPKTLESVFYFAVLMQVAIVGLCKAGKRDHEAHAGSKLAQILSQHVVLMMCWNRYT
jgi:hypothetical protein